jgi:predicted negative regulator of RcsB-dependent stress response
MSGTDLSQFGRPMARDHSEAAIRAAFRRKWTFWGVALAIVCIVGGLLSWHTYVQSIDREQTIAFLRAQTIYDSELEAFSKKLETNQDLAQIENMRPDHSKSTPLFKEFAEKYADTPLGWQASLRVSQELIKGGDSEGAIALLSPIVSRTRRFPVLQTKVRRALAGLYAEKGDFSKALAEVAIIEKIKENPVPDQTLLFKGQLLYLSGDKEGARDVLRKLSDGSGLDNVLVSQDVSLDAALWLDFWKLN